MKISFIHNIHNFSLVNNIFLLFLIYIFLSVPIPIQAQDKPIKQLREELGNLNRETQLQVQESIVANENAARARRDADAAARATVAQAQGCTGREGAGTLYHTDRSQLAGCADSIDKPTVDDSSDFGNQAKVDPEPTADGGTELSACSGAFDHAINTVCHESSWSHIGKAMAAFASSQASGDIKGACDAAKTLNGAGAAVNTEFTTSCGGALGTCVTLCGEDKTKVEAQLTKAQAQAASVLGPPDLREVERLNAKLVEINSKIATCGTKKKSNKVKGSAQILQSLQAFNAADKCSKDATDDSQTANTSACSDFPQSLQAICLENGARETCNLYPSLPVCQRLKANETDAANAANIDPLDLDGEFEDDLALTACLENPLSSSCQSSFCSGLPTSPMRDVCNTDGVSAFCENLPNLPQCKDLAAANGGGRNCSGLPTQNLIEECQTSGRDSFCERHSQLTFCKDAEGIGDNELSELAQLDDSGPGGSGGGGGSGSGGGGFGGSSKGDGFDPSSDSIGGSDGELTAEELQALRDQGIDTGGPSARGGFGRRGSRFKPEKFKPFDIKGLFGKKKKDAAKRSISSVNSSLEISSANGLTNFQKVSRAMKARYPIFFENQVKQANRAF